MGSASAKIQEPSMEEILASIRRIIADDQDSGRAEKPAEAEELPRGQEDVLDLAELEAAAMLPGSDLELPEQDLSFLEDKPAEFGPPKISEPVAPKIEAAASRELPARQDFGSGLLSPAVDSSVSQAFGLLSSTISNQSLSSTVLNPNPRTLEDLVGELLRPLLKGWLDEHLPPLVERLVKAEIERLARGGR
jgi:cell pole-organizing protein PopZ